MNSIFYWGIMDWFRFVIVLTNLINMAFVTKQIHRNTKLFLLNKKLTKMCLECKLDMEHSDLPKLKIVHMKALLSGFTLLAMIISCIVIVLL